MDIGPASPTGLTFGTRAKFPAKYQRALFACDWTFGTMYAVHLTPDGATYRAEKEEFLSGKPLALTDVVINPRDGAMYFVIGGRFTQSALYRVTYVGADSTKPVKPLSLTSQVKLRRNLESLRAAAPSRRALDTLWKDLGSQDRFVRFAARTALERQPSAQWAERALAETEPRTATQALIALARVGDKNLQPRLLESLGRIDAAYQAPELRIQLLRAWQLAFTRMGEPAPEIARRWAQHLEPSFPTGDALADRELAALLVYLGSETVVAKAVPLLAQSEPRGSAPEERASKSLLARNDFYGAAVRATVDGRPDRQQIALAYALRKARIGWTSELRRRYFAWFPTTADWDGGISFNGFIDQIRIDALAGVSDPAERQALEKLSTRVYKAKLPFDPYVPKGPGQAYTVAEASALMTGKLQERSLERGKSIFATNCGICHRYMGAGGGIGPDLTTVGHRFSVPDILESIIEPGKVVSDQYQNVMPPGLLNTLNPDEVRDLLAFLIAGMDPENEMFKRAK